MVNHAGARAVKLPENSRMAIFRLRPPEPENDLCVSTSAAYEEQVEETRLQYY